MTLIFIHGGMQGGWCWEKMRPLLEAKNLQMLTPCLSSLGTRAHLHGETINLSIHIQDIVSLIALLKTTAMPHQKPSVEPGTTKQKKGTYRFF